MADQTKRTTCAGCGAALPEGATTCDLCGTPVDEAVWTDNVDDLPDELTGEGPLPELPRPAPATSSAADVFCNQCGWKNPAGSKFCSRCGAALQSISAAAIPGSGYTPERGVPVPSRRTGLILAGAGVLLVGALFLVTVVSKRNAPAPSAGAPAAAAEQASPAEGATTGAAVSPATPLPPEIARRAEALEAEIGRASGKERTDKQAQLVSLYASAGRLDKAAPVQEELAQAVNTPEAWTQAGNLLFDWMEQTQGTDKSAIATRAVAAYKRVLQVQPDNLDVRTDMAWAYQYDPQNAMEAINQTNLVLQKNPSHYQANFNKGIFLIQIGRLDGALAQFEKARGLAAAGSTQQQHADQAIQAVKQMQAQQGSAAPSGSQPSRGM